MARKPASKSEFVLFHVIYDDGSQRSNRRVPREVVDSTDGDAAVRAFFESQDRDIAERSGAPLPAIKAVKRAA